MIFKLLVIFVVVFQTKLVSSMRIPFGKSQFYLNDDFEAVRGNGAIEGTNLVLEKVKALEEPVPPTDDSHHPVDQVNIAHENARKKSINHNNFQTVNDTAEYLSGQENGTWNLEKKEKAIDVRKENSKGEFASCQATTDLVASAQATVSRALKGLCNSRDMEEKFDDLENSITNQLNVLKKIILDLEVRLDEHGKGVLLGQKQLSAIFSKECGSEVATTPNSDLNNKNHKTSPELLGSKPSSEDGPDVAEEEVSGTRDPEILKFNSSIHTETSGAGPPRKVFTYYWKIKDMTHKLTGWNPRKSFRSQSFYIFPGGYRMYMRVFPRQDENNLYVRVGLTKGEFDDNLKWPFPLKHKIHILDQTKEGRLFEDIASRIWDPNLLCGDFNWQRPVKGDNHECVEIGFPHDVLKQREYVRDNSLVVKLTVYLDS